MFYFTLLPWSTIECIYLHISWNANTIFFNIIYVEHWRLNANDILNPKFSLDCTPFPSPLIPNWSYLICGYTASAKTNSDWKGSRQAVEPPKFAKSKQIRTSEAWTSSSGWEGGGRALWLATSLASWRPKPLNFLNGDFIFPIQFANRISVRKLKLISS